MSNVYVIDLYAVSTNIELVRELMVKNEMTRELEYEAYVELDSFQKNKIKVEDIQSIFLKEFDKIDWEYVDTRIIPMTENLPDQGVYYYMIFKNDIGIDISQPYLIKAFLNQLLKVSEDLDAHFYLYDLSLNIYQNFCNGEYDSGYMEGNEYPEDHIKKLKNRLGL